jgi:hypothetical protein
MTAFVLRLVTPGLVLNKSDADGGGSGLAEAHPLVIGAHGPRHLHPVIAALVAAIQVDPRNESAGDERAVEPTLPISADAT